MHTSSDSEIPLLSLCHRLDGLWECTEFFITVEDLKQPKCLLIGRELNKWSTFYYRIYLWKWQGNYQYGLIFRLHCSVKKQKQSTPRVFIGVCYPMWQFYWLGVLITLDIWDIWNVLFLYSQKNIQRKYGRKSRFDKAVCWATQWFSMWLSTFFYHPKIFHNF